MMAGGQRNLSRDRERRGHPHAQFPSSNHEALICGSHLLLQTLPCRFAAPCLEHGRVAITKRRDTVLISAALREVFSSSQMSYLAPIQLTAAAGVACIDGYMSLNGNRLDSHATTRIRPTVNILSRLNV